jgi:hypothetical protein
MLMENMINIKSGWRHSVLEFQIRKLDVGSQDMSRAAVFEREVKAAEKVEDWKLIQNLLSKVDKIDEAPLFTNLQAKYDDVTGKILTKVRSQMFEDLKPTGLKRLQTQYMVLLLQANYLYELGKNILTIRVDGPNDEDINLPEMAKILCDMMLSDKECEDLRTIRKIMIDWRKNR